MVGRHNPFYGKTHSEETLVSIKETKIKNGTWKAKLSDEHKEKIKTTSKITWQNEELKLRTVETRKKNGNWKMSEDGKRKISLVMKGKKLSDETKEKIRQSRLGKVQFVETEITRANRSKAAKGKRHSWQDKINKNPEKIKKTADKHRGMKRTEETKKNISDAKKNKIRVYNIENGKYIYLDKTSSLPDGYCLWEDWNNYVRT